MPTKSTKRRVKVKNLQAKKKTLTSKDAKKVKGGFGPVVSTLDIKKPGSTKYQG